MAPSPKSMPIPHRHDERLTVSVSRFDFNLLVALDALLSECSVTAAAKRVGVTQSAMSGMLARLREQFQDPLLVRMGSALVPTPRGISLQPEIRNLLLQAQKLIVPNSEFKLAETRRELKIMATEHSAILILPAVYRCAAEAAPGLTFDILALEAPAQKVATGEVDLCLTGDLLEGLGKTVAEILRTRTVMLEQFVAIVDIAHPVTGNTIGVEALRQYPHVVTQFPGVARTVEEHVTKVPAAARSVEEIVRSVDQASFKTAIRVPNFITIGPAVVGSQRIGIIPATLVPLITSTWPLRPMALPPEVSPTCLRMLWHIRNDADPVHQWLRKTIEDACAVLPRP